MREQGMNAGWQRGLKVLIADDNEDAADMLAALIRTRGHEVEVVHDGREAVLRATQLQPDVALLDIGMPELDGRQAAAQIRKQRGCEHVLLVAVSGWEDDRDQAGDQVFDRHLTKPIDIESLSQLLNERLQGSR